MLTGDEIIKLAREAGLGNVLGIVEGGALHRFFYMAQAAEQDRCCRIVYGMCDSDNAAQRTVNAIRAKGNA